MSFVLIDVPSFVVTMVGDTIPKVLQLVLPGLTPGSTLAVSGRAGDFTWPVRGGQGAVAAEQIILVDAAAPLGVEFVYDVTVDGVLWTSPGTIQDAPAGVDVVLSSLNGRAVVLAGRNDATDTVEQTPRIAAFQIPGRETPVMRYDTAIAEVGAMVLETSASATTTMRDLVRIGAPLVVRTCGLVRDVPLVQTVVITKAPRELVGAVGTLRSWAVGYQVIRQPEMGTVLAVSTWDDFDAAYASSTWTAFDAEWSELTWDAFDRTDWTQR